MAEASIPVDLFNPGQVFACLGLMEAAETLLGDAQAAFDWSDEADTRFLLRAAGEKNPVEEVLSFLAGAEVATISPDSNEVAWLGNSSVWPVRLSNGEHEIDIASWLEGDGRSALKTFAGQQSGENIIRGLLKSEKPQKGNKGVLDLRDSDGDELISNPFGLTCPVGGRFGFDARGAWDGLRAGMSPDRLKFAVLVSPLVELLAAFGLQDARPHFVSTYVIHYSAWSRWLPPNLSRVALAAPRSFLPLTETRNFQAHLGNDQKYKKCFFAELRGGQDDQ